MPDLNPIAQKTRALPGRAPDGAGMLPTEDRSVKRTDFPEEGLAALAALREHFWFVHRNDVITAGLRRVLPKPATWKVIDLGTGAGAVAHHLLRRGHPVVASDLFASAVRSLPDDLKSTFFQFDLLRDEVPASHAKRYDVAILGDVIEHLEHPLEALRRATEFVRPGGVVLITVPASMLLWTDYDVTSGHKRRYTSRGLRVEMVLGGLAPICVEHFMFSPGALLLVQRRLLRATAPPKTQCDEDLRVPPLINAMLRTFLRLESAARALCPLPWGSSLLGIGRVL